MHLPSNSTSRVMSILFVLGLSVLSFPPHDGLDHQTGPRPKLHAANCPDDAADLLSDSTPPRGYLPASCAGEIHDQIHLGERHHEAQS
ncbi:hypothetical protein BX600DRAFT_476768 [Xylariales sp. PMI_506]|nr:hypothetical protein BX600DRAFT_476768 [Xylariales sp. PMI_506]